MDKKQTGIIATVATSLTCGCLGLCLCIFGAVTAAGVMPYTTELNGFTEQGIVPSGWGFALLCLALIFIAIPIVVGVVTLRQPKATAPEGTPVVHDIDEPLPPAS